MGSTRLIAGGVAVLILASSLSGCAWFGGKEKVSPLAGTWKNSIGAVWIMRDDGTFEVDLDRDHHRDAWGTYRIKDDLITLQAGGGLQPRGCDEKGVYRFKRENETLHFTLVNDGCRLRRKNVQLPWRLKSPSQTNDRVGR